MSGFDDLFRPNPPERVHPFVRHVREVLSRGATVSLEVMRSFEGLGYAEPELYLVVDGHLTRMPWDSEVNEALIRLRIPTVSLDNEQLRFALTLEDRFDPIEVQVGAGYFDAVLLEYLCQRGFDQAPETSEMLSSVYRHGRAHAGPHKDSALSAIDRVFIETASDLKELVHSAELAPRILDGAFALYLDKRFSITNRRRLGLR